MNLRKITENYEDTLETLKKIYKEYDFIPVSARLSHLNESINCGQLKDPEFQFYSAFENGAEIAVLVTKNREICSLSVKKYAQKRGVGRSLLGLYLDILPENTTVSVNIEPEFEDFYKDLNFHQTDDELKNFEGIDYITMIFRK